MLVQQKRDLELLPIKQMNSHSLIHKIETQNQKFKILISSIRRNASQDESFITESQVSRMTPLSMDHRIPITKDQEIYSSSRSNWNRSFNRMEQNGLQNKKVKMNKLHNQFNINKIIKNLDVIKLEEPLYPHHKKIDEVLQNQQNGYESPINQFKKSNEDISKKPSSFRIKQKNEPKNSSLKECKTQRKNAKNKINPENQQFEVESFDYQLLVQKLSQKKLLDFQATANQINNFFEDIICYCKFKKNKESVLKKYKNCVYFGPKIDKGSSQTYVGMAWYYRKIFYYGQFVQSRKHGSGVQVSFNEGYSIWKGNFENGLKKGYFEVISPECKYYGMVSNSAFNGEGTLKTSKSQYNGHFKSGKKEGSGWQKFGPKHEYKGEYLNDKFDGEGELKSNDYYYKGLFKNGKADGYGFERTSEYQYLGQFVDGNRQGKGKIKTPQGDHINCIFKKGMIIKQLTQGTDRIYEKYASKQLDGVDEQNQEATVQQMLDQLNILDVNQEDPLQYHSG